MKTHKIEAKNKIAIKGDRDEPIIVAVQNIKQTHPELYRELIDILI